MATFKEICESVLAEANGRPTEFPSTNLGKDADGDYYVTDPTQRNIIQWVNDLNLRKQQMYVQASFMHKYGVFLQVREGVEEYRKKYVREIDQNSLYSIPAGTSGRMPINVCRWEDWQQQERTGATTSGVPLTLIRMPDEKWLLDVVPIGDYSIYGSWWVFPSLFDEPDDEPLWDCSLHDILKWEALQLFALEFLNEAQHDILSARINLMLPTLDREFRRRYLPDFEQPDQLM